MMVLQFCEKYVSNAVVLSLFPVLCNHGNLTLKLYTSQKIATIIKGDLL